VPRIACQHAELPARQVELPNVHVAVFGHKEAGCAAPWFADQRQAHRFGELTAGPDAVEATLGPSGDGRDTVIGKHELPDGVVLPVADEQAARAIGRQPVGPAEACLIAFAVDVLILVRGTREGLDLEGAQTNLADGCAIRDIK
jgi:hypothetical protein